MIRTSEAAYRSFPVVETIERNRDVAQEKFPIHKVQRQPGWRGWLLLLMAAALCYLWGLWAHGFLDNNEGLYAEIPREMAAHGDWVTPHLNGVKYLEKPPLLYWLVALNYKIFGFSEMSARLVPAMSALLTAALVVLFCAYESSAFLGWLAGFILLTTFGFVQMSHVVMGDMLLTCCVAASMFALYFAMRKGGWMWAALSGAALAGGVLTKGMLAFVLPLAVSALYIFFRRDFAALRRMNVAGILLVFFAVAAPWHILASLRNPGFFQFYFVNEQFLRFFHMREPKDYYSGPVWYYLPRVYAGMLPWSFLLPAGLVLGFRRLRAQQWDSFLKLKEEQPFIGYCFLWFAVFFLFFSASQAKANYYLILVQPPLAILCASAAVRWFKGVKTRIFSFVVAVPALFQCVLLAAALVWLHGYAGRFHISYALTLLALLSLSCLLACSLSVFVPYFRAPLRMAFLFGLGFSVFTLLSLHVVSSLEAEFSSKSLASSVRKFHRTNERIVVHGRYEGYSGISFYLHKRIVEFDGDGGDLEWGSRWEGRSSYFVSTQKMPFWSRKHSSFIYIAHPDDVPALQRILPRSMIVTLQVFKRQFGKDRGIYRVMSHR